MDRLESLAGGRGPERTAVREAADALRKAIEAVVATTAPPEVLEDAAAQIRAVADTLAQYPHGHNYINAEASITGHVGDFFDNSPVAGLGNPLAAPVRMRVEGDEVIGEVTWGSAYEGPPGCCHGGYVAAAFDDVLGLAQDLAGQSGMTGTLTIRYRRPTPLHREHRFVARLDRVEGRKIFTTGELYDPEGNVLAEGEGIFIAVDFAKLQQLADGRKPPSG
ncbi:MAG: PaaI family thioesterase [Acidimicrobiales bacterium]|nr:PaaI family thioesterase [Acidimicrobiales bacterium]